MVPDIEELEKMDASEIYAKRLNAKEVIFSKRKWKIHIPSRRWTNKIRWRRSRTSTSIRDHPIQREGQRDFLGESEWQDSYPDAGEARNDSWSISGNFIFRHHVEPRVKLYSPREDSFSIPLKYIDVSRTTLTNLDVCEKAASMIIGISMDQEICLILGQVSLILVY